MIALVCLSGLVYKYLICPCRLDLRTAHVLRGRSALFLPSMPGSLHPDAPRLLCVAAWLALEPNRSISDDIRKKTRCMITHHLARSNKPTIFLFASQSFPRCNKQAVYHYHSTRPSSISISVSITNPVRDTMPFRLLRGTGQVVARRLVLFPHGTYTVHNNDSTITQSPPVKTKSNFPLRAFGPAGKVVEVVG